MKLALLSIAILGLALVSPITVLAASTPNISVPVSTIVRGDVGSTKVLGSQAIDQELIGMDCSVNATAENQGSVHPGNDLIVSSGEDTVTLANVEREANGLTQANGVLTLSDELKVTLRLGADKVFSGGMTVNLTCEEPKEVQVCRDGAIITVREDEVTETDTDVCTVDVCRDDEIVTINQDDRLDSDTDTCVVEEPKQIEVCREGSIITIDEADRKTSDTDSCPQVLGAGVAKELPKTGASSLVAFAVAGSGVFGTVAHSIAIRRRS